MATPLGADTFLSVLKHAGLGVVEHDRWCTQTGRYLDPWYKRLHDAYVETMADMGVTTDLAGQ